MSTAINYCNATLNKQVKPGGRIVVSQALVKPASANLKPRLHIKRGDMVMLMSGSEKCGCGKTGKVLNVFPKSGKAVVEGLNIITRATRKQSAGGKSGLIKKEAPLFASRLMLYCTACKKPTRIAHKFLEKGKKNRICKHCLEAFE